MNIKKICNVGESKGIILPKSLLTSKGWDNDTELAVIPYNEGIYLVPKEFFDDHQTEYEKEELYHRNLMIHVLSNDKTIIPHIVQPKQTDIEEKPIIQSEIPPTNIVEKSAEKTMEELEKEVKNETVTDNVVGAEEKNEEETEEKESPIVYTKLKPNPNVEVIVPDDLFL